MSSAALAVRSATPRTFLHPRHAPELKGSRLAFVQGGPDGSRLVLLTSPITVKVWASNCESRWTPCEMPFKYSEAPLIIDNLGNSDFPLIAKFACKTRCPTFESGLSSRLRSRSTPLPPDLARHVVSVYERHRKRKGRSAIARIYHEALPYVTKIDRNRRDTRRRLIRKLAAEIEGADAVVNRHTAASKTQKPSGCAPSRRRRAGRTKCSTNLDGKLR
jgi:hypothetical protein